MIIVKVFFWMSILGVVIKFLQVSCCDHPRIVQFSKLEDAIGLILNVALLVWCWRVAWP